jgi:hypothetical protein
MFGPLFSGEAYRTSMDLELRKDPITLAHEAPFARKYRIEFHVKTLIGPGMFTNRITIGFDLDVPDYPFSEPISWLISPEIPFSPYFKKGTFVCIGDIWQWSKGEMYLGQLLVHIAKLLNWEPGTANPGYTGRNPEASAYYQRVFGKRPITEGLHYPALPLSFYGIHPDPLLNTDTLFRPIGLDSNKNSSLSPGQSEKMGES